jgi:hypothetical protein
MEEKNGSLVFWLLFASKSDKIKISERCLILGKIDDLLFELILFSRSAAADRRKDPLIRAEFALNLSELQFT